MTHLDQIGAGRLQASLLWADTRSARSGSAGFSPRLFADRVQAPADEVARWLHVLAVLGLLLEQRTPGGMVYRVVFRPAPSRRAA